MAARHDHVTTASDAANHTGTSLRDALGTANVDAYIYDQSDTITFDSSLSNSTITLTQGQLNVQSDNIGTITIDGTGQGISISGNNVSRVLFIDLESPVALHGIGITGGNTSSDNTDGAGILSNGVLTIDRCSFTNDKSGDNGGALEVDFGSASISLSTFSGNSSASDGGAIYNDGTMIAGSSQFSGNAAGDEGGCIDNQSTLTVGNCTFSGNDADFGGGIANAGSLTIGASTLFKNTAGIGAGIRNSGTLTVSNSTFFGNTTGSSNETFGGAFANEGTLTISNSTLSGNNAGNGGGIDGGDSTLISTIVAGNTSNGAYPDISGNVQSTSTNNLIGDDYGVLGISNGSNGNQIGTEASPIDPDLEAIYFNGGPTKTMALDADSPARDGGGSLTSVNGLLSATATSIPVGLASAIASTPGSYLIRIDSEELLVTNVDTANNTLTVTRGYNGTTAATHSDGARVYLFNDQRGQPRDSKPDIGAFEYQSLFSTVNALPATESSNTFAVTWSGHGASDGPSISSYTIFVSDNGGAYTIFQNMTAATIATFSGQYGHTYRFYSVATDAAGNVQATPTAAQATTTIAYPSYTINEGDPGYAVTAGTWYTSSLKGYDNSETAYCLTPSASATWTPTLPAGYYTVKFYNLVSSNSTSSARVSVLHNGVTNSTTISQTSGSTGFTTLGTYYFSGTGGESVSVTNLGSGYLRANAVQFTLTSATDQAPVITAPATQTAKPNTALTFSAANSNAISFADADAASTVEQLTLTAPNGTLVLGSSSGITYTSGGSGQSTFTIKGTLAALNTAASGLKFTAASNYVGPTTLKLSLNDLSAVVGGPMTATKTIALTVGTPIVVTAGGTGYSQTAGTWAASSVTGYNGSASRYSSTVSASAKWMPTLTAGTYQVQFYNLVGAGNTGSARVSVVHQGLTASSTISQLTGSSGLISLGLFTFGGTGGEYVSLANLSSGFLRSNVVLFTKVS